MTDPSQLPVDSQHVFGRDGLVRLFKRVPGGWNDGDRFLDDLQFEEEGWRYLRPAA